MEKTYDPIEALRTVLLQEHGMRCPWQNQCGCYRFRRCHLVTRPKSSRSRLCKQMAMGSSVGKMTPRCQVAYAIEGLSLRYLDDAQVCGPPVPSTLVYLLDRSHKIDFELVRLKSHRGATWLADGHWVIFLGTNQANLERRFTLFHEGFHIVCRTNCPEFHRSAICAYPFLERAADYFAACILMPAKWVETMWLEVREVARMARTFDVTEATMRARLKQLGLA